MICSFRVKIRLSICYLFFILHCKNAL
jgi:hypothetical protein